MNSAIHWINHYPADNSIGFASVYPLDSDLSGGQRYPSFEQLEPDCVSRKTAFNYLQVSSLSVTSISADYVQRFFKKNATVNSQFINSYFSFFSQ